MIIGRIDRLLDPLRPPVRAVRRFEARALHPVRKSRAERVIERSAPRSLLFICTGNICRSPYAEKVFQTILETGVGSGIRIDSAGLLESGRPPPEPAVRIGRERGVHLADHRSKTIDREMLSAFDLIVGMDSKHERGVRRVTKTATIVLLGDLDPTVPDRRGIRDPWGCEDDVFRSSFDRIDRCLARLEALVRGDPGAQRGRP